jgi:hypothetical protein
MPHTLSSFADRFGFELTDDADSVDDDHHDSAYNPADNESDDDDDNLNDYGADSDGDESDDDNADEDEPDDNNADDPDEPEARIFPSGGSAPTVVNGTTGVNRNKVTLLDEDEEDEVSETEEEDAKVPEQDDNEPPELTPRLEYSDNDDSDSEDNNEPPEIEGVPMIRQTGVSESDKEEAEAEMNQKYGPRQHSRSLRDQKPPKYAPRYDRGSFEDNMAQFEHLMRMLFMTEQMPLKRGLKRFGKAGADAVVSEMQQLEIRKVLKPTKASDPTKS